MARNFNGTTAQFYARYRRGYPVEVVDAIVDRLRLDGNDLVVDLGCGTGLMTRPLAERVRLVLGVDPEPDMLAEARHGTSQETWSKLLWVLGSEADIPALSTLASPTGLGAVVVAQALHFIDHEALFARGRTFLRPGGGFAIVSNGLPLWQQESSWSRALRASLEEWFRTPLSSTCGTSPEDRARYRTALSHAGFAVEEVRHQYETEVSIDAVIGGLFSAISPADLPDGRRGHFAAHVERALGTGPFVERVPVTALIGVLTHADSGI